ncbi:MAG TPA: GNAT family N-acetyltransferase [Anaerolineales bacterium]
MKNPFIIRHYAPEKDLSLLSHLLTEIESIDRDGEDTSEEYLRASLAWPNYRPDQDVWVAESEGMLLGYGVALEQPSQRCTIYVVVHPSHRRKGLGSRLLELTLNRAHEPGLKNILVYANDHNSASNFFLNHHGFVPVGSSGAMKAPASIQIPSSEFPSGFTLKRYSEVNNSLILLAALDDCYLDMWGHQHNDKRTEEEIQSPRFLKYYDADDILLLFDAKNAVSGICSLKSEGKRDENGDKADLLDAPGVIKEYREQGYQRQLVLAGMQHLRKMGTRPIVLEFWGDHENILNIYHSLGFDMLNHYITYHKELE